MDGWMDEELKCWLISSTPVTANLVGPGVILMTLEDDRLPRLWCGDVDHFITIFRCPCPLCGWWLPWLSSDGETPAGLSSEFSSSSENWQSGSSITLSSVFERSYISEISSSASLSQFKFCGRASSAVNLLELIFGVFVKEKAWEKGQGQGRESPSSTHTWVSGSPNKVHQRCMFIWDLHSYLPT